MRASLTYRPTLRQAGVFLLVVAGAMVLGGVLSRGWDTSGAVSTLVGLLLVSPLYVRQGVRLDDRGVTLLRGLFSRRLPWERVTGLEQSRSWLRGRYLVVRTPDDTYPLAFPSDAPLLRDRAFDAKAARLHAEISRRALGAGPVPPR